MAHRRSMSPIWDGAVQGRIKKPADDDGDEEDDSSNFSKAIKGLVRRVVDPNHPDGSNPVVNGASASKPWLRNLIADIATQIPRTGSNVALLSSISKTQIFDGGIVNDRQYQMEKIIELLASLPMKSGAQNDLSATFIRTLWENLQHPPVSLLGNPWKYRMADGSNNNLKYPDLGKAGSYYARTISPQTAQPGIKPDPGVIFESIFARRTEPKPHPSKISSMLFYLASIIIHDVFHTDERDSSKVKTSSYLDLAPLYGSSEEELFRVRTFKDGLLKPDSFCEPRILGFPPGVSALLVCFNRYHNYVAMELKEINENGRFTIPEDPHDETGFKRLDNDLFQTARLVTCGLYVNIILNDYVRTILNLNRVDTPWTLDPRENFNEFFDTHGVPSGIGNQVSVEFNLIYRWHSAISKKDEKWMNDIYQKLFPGQNIEELTEAQFAYGFHKWMAEQGQDPSQWTLDFGKYQRTKNGTFRDQDLTDILTAATEDVACALGARQVPVALKLVEIMGIKQARQWNVATLNEFRKYFQLRPYQKFSEITSDVEVAHALKSLYEEPDYVELYPGLIAEETKATQIPGSGLCLGFTTSRTILADAVALVRGDRFYTIDYSPANLTNWGWEQVQSDQDVASGHCIYNLFMRALPNYYRGNSIYAMFPFVIPEENKNIMSSLNKTHEYSFATPSFTPIPPALKTLQGVVDVLKDQQTFHVPWGEHIAQLIGGKHPYMLGRDDGEGQAQRHDVAEAMYCPVDGMSQVREFYEALTTQLIMIHSERLRGEWYQLDACRDVANLSHAIFVARLWQIPLRGKSDKTIGVDVDKLYLALSIMFAYVFLDADTAKSFKLRSAAKTACDQLSGLVKVVCEAIHVGNRLHVSKLFEMGHAGEMLSQYGEKLLQRLFKQGKSVNEVVAIVMPTAAAAVATQAQHLTQMLNIYLSEPHNKHWPEIQRCAWSDDPGDFDALKRYALEANRLAPAAYGLLREATEEVVVEEGDVKIHLNKKDKLYLDFIAVGRDPKAFPNPEEIDINRKDPPYIHHGYGAHACLGREMVEVAMATQLRVFAKLKNLRRAPGPQGQMKTSVPAPNPVSSNPVPNPGGITVFMKEDWTDWWPFPTTLKVHHDGFYKHQDEYLIKNTGLPHRNTDLEESRLNNLKDGPPTPDAHANGYTNGYTNGVNDQA